MQLQGRITQSIGNAVLSKLWANRAYNNPLWFGALNNEASNHHVIACLNKSARADVTQSRDSERHGIGRGRARSDRGHAPARERSAHIYRHRDYATIGRTVAQLPKEVVPSGKDFPLGGQRDRMEIARGDGGHGLARERSGHIRRHRRFALKSGRAVAQLFIGAVAPGKDFPL